MKNQEERSRRVQELKRKLAGIQDHYNVVNKEEQENEYGENDHNY
jgi:hypothetical protein